MPYQPFENQEYRNVFQAWLEIPTLLSFFPVPPGQRLLEVGCGLGVALPRLAKLCAPSKLVGVDIDSTLVAGARRRVERAGARAEVYTADVRQLPFRDGQFDVVIYFGTCYHIDHPAGALREIARVLRDGGVFIHEAPLAQRIAHPGRGRKHHLPWTAAAELLAERRALLWASRRKIPSH